MKKLRAILVGFGTVGTGVARVIHEKARELAKNYGLDVKVVAICEKEGCIVEERGIELGEVLKLKAAGKLSSHPSWRKERSLSVIKSVPAEIVIEMTPTNIETGEPGLAHIRAAFENGKSVITSNKGPLALRYWELMEAARKAGQHLLFEATVCGGMPTMNMVRHCMQLNRISSIKGILNGTTNYILTKMHEDNMSFAAALQEAKELGYAEADPTYDIEGIDAAAKLVILANSIMGMKKSYADVKRTGIKDVTMEAVALAKANDFVIKLIGEVNAEGMSVAPRLLHKLHPLNVGGTLNALLFEADLAKEVIVIGRGAGQIETASAILNDLIELSRNIEPKVSF
ncbi:MAG: homoserine dehydrogenase [Candidatus Micrarchaeia archaeon]